MGTDVKERTVESQASRLWNRRPTRGTLPLIGAQRPVTPITEAPPRASVARRDRIARRLLLGGDAIAAMVAVALAMGLDNIHPASVLAPLLLVLTCKVGGLYDADSAVMRRSTLDEVPRLVQISGIFALLAWFGEAPMSSGALNKTHVLVLWILTFIGVTLARGSARALCRRLTPAERCAVVGDVDTAARIEQKLGDSRVKAEIVASIWLQPGVAAQELRNPGNFTAFLHDRHIERLILAPIGDGDAAHTLDLVRIAKAAGVRVSLLPRLMEVLGSSIEFENLDGMAVLGVRPLGLSRSSRAIKRTVDMVGSALVMVAALPVLAAVALAVKLDSQGAVFFRQKRVGKDGRHFEMIKFRSMVDGADSQKAELTEHNETVGLFKIAADPRITRVGRWLRSTSLDELPQLLNVLKGEMSLVGPRPLVLEEDALVSGLDRARLELTPGMTGPWQILGPARVPLREMVAIDYLYVANWSLWGDLTILIRTALHVVRRGGM